MKYKMELLIESEEELGTIDELLDGSMLYDSDFQGAILKSKLIRLKR